MIFLVDIDQTLTRGIGGKARPMSPKVLLKAIENGHEVIYYTARPNFREDETMGWLVKNGFPNPEKVILTDKKGTIRKYCSSRARKKRGTACVVVDDKDKYLEYAGDLAHVVKISKDSDWKKVMRFAATKG